MNPAASDALLSPGYAGLPNECFARVDPTPVSSPGLVALNAELAESLGLSREWLSSPEGVRVLSGNAPLPGVAPISMAYAGHQFGNWVPSLGDGRAILIGESQFDATAPREIQLKGAGRTPFSRGGDGRAALGPVLREYVVSEAMHALGIPTTRALAMVTTGDVVARETDEPGAILTRVSSGHIRVGTFQYFHARGARDHVRALADFVIERRYPDAAGSDAPYRTLLERVIEAQAELIAGWMGVGFIHGVMNTDNMSVMGETIDYGPCAFMDDYDPGKVFSSIDRMGRYAYDQQPGIGLWNLTRFAETLLSLLSPNDEAAVEIAQAALSGYAPRFESAYRRRLLRKIGLTEETESNFELASRLLQLMAEENADFTLTFRALSRLPESTGAEGEAAEPRALFAHPERFDAWATDWRARIASQSLDDDARRQGMRAANPAYIPRNHRVQQAIDAAAQGRLGPFEDLCTVTRTPFEDHPQLSNYADAPLPHEVVARTFCGT